MANKLRHGVPARAFDNLNRRRRRVGVRGQQKSELFQKLPVAVSADEFINEIGTDNVPIATVRRMALYFTVELSRLTPLIKELLLVGGTPLRADFLEAICVLEATLGEGASLTEKWRKRVIGNGYQDCIEGMEIYKSRMGGFPSGHRGWKMKANALLWALNTFVEARAEPKAARDRPPRQPFSVMVQGEQWDVGRQLLDAAE